MGRYAITIVLALTFALMAYGHGLRVTLFTSETEAARNHNTNQARNIAISAATIAVQKLIDEDDSSLNAAENTTRRIPDAEGNFRDWEEMNGGYRFEITNTGDTLHTVRAIGQFGNQTYAVDVVLVDAEDVWDPNVRRAVFAGTRIDMSGSARVFGHVGTNSTAVGAVTMGWSARIDSTLALGPGAVPALSLINPVPFYGNIGDGVTNLVREEVYELPEFPSPPATTLIAPSITVSGSTNQTISHSYFEDRYVPTISIQSNTTLTINVGNEDRVLHVGNLDISQGRLVVNGTGKLTIHIDNQWNLGGSSRMNDGRSPETMFVYYAGTNQLDFAGSTRYFGGVYAQTANVHLGGSGGIQGNIMTGGSSVRIYGAAEANSRILFAPNAHVEVTGSGRVRGALIADRFTASGAAQIIFATEFDDTFPEMRGGGSRRMSVRAWR